MANFWFYLFSATCVRLNYRASQGEGRGQGHLVWTTVNPSPCERAFVYNCCVCRWCWWFFLTSISEDPSIWGGAAVFCFVSLKKKISPPFFNEEKYLQPSCHAASKLHHQACHLQNIKLKVSNLEVDYTCCLQKLKRHLCRKKTKTDCLKTSSAKKTQRFEPTISVLFFVFSLKLQTQGDIWASWGHVSTMEVSVWGRGNVSEFSAAIGPV